MKEYMLVHENDIQAMESKIDLHLQQGWELQGGVSICDGKSTENFSYCQAMTRETKAG